MLLLDTGLRLKEVTALTTDDLNMETGAVIVRKGKGGKFRTVFMGAKVRRAMSISLSYPSYFRQFVVLTLGSSIQVSFLGPSGCMRSCHSNLDLKQSDPGSYLGPSARSMRCHSSFGFEVRFAIWFS